MVLIYRDGSAQVNHGGTEMGQGLQTKIRQIAADGLGVTPSAIRLMPDFAIALNNRAWAYFKSGRPAMGREDVERSLELDPSSPHTYDTRAHIRQWTGQPAGALSDYDRAMAFGGQRMIKLYQCGLAAAGLYKGPADGQSSIELRRAFEACVMGTTCDPLPADEECKAATS